MGAAATPGPCATGGSASCHPDPHIPTECRSGRPVQGETCADGQEPQEVAVERHPAQGPRSVPSQVPQMASASLRLRCRHHSPSAHRYRLWD